MRELTDGEVGQVAGGRDYPAISGYVGAGAIMAVVGFGVAFTPIGPVVGAIALGTAGGLAGAQAIADYC